MGDAVQPSSVIDPDTSSDAAQPGSMGPFRTGGLPLSHGVGARHQNHAVSGNYVSTSVSGDYYQAMFAAEKDSDDTDSPYLLIQRQFEMSDGGECYIEMHDSEHSGHFLLRRVEFTRQELLIEFDRPTDIIINVTFDMTISDFRKASRVMKIISQLKEGPITHGSLRWPVIFHSRLQHRWRKSATHLAIVLCNLGQSGPQNPEFPKVDCSALQAWDKKPAAMAEINRIGSR